MNLRKRLSLHDLVYSNIFNKETSIVLNNITLKVADKDVMREYIGYKIERQKRLYWLCFPFLLMLLMFRLIQIYFRKSADMNILINPLFSIAYFSVYGLIFKLRSNLYSKYVLDCWYLILIIYNIAIIISDKGNPNLTWSY